MSSSIKKIVTLPKGSLSNRAIKRLVRDFESKLKKDLLVRISEPQVSCSFRDSVEKVLRSEDFICTKIQLSEGEPCFCAWPKMLVYEVLEQHLGGAESSYVRVESKDSTYCDYQVAILLSSILAPLLNQGVVVKIGIIDTIGEFYIPDVSRRIDFDFEAEKVAPTVSVFLPSYLNLSETEEATREILLNVRDQDLKKALWHEHPQVVAAIMSLLDAKRFVALSSIMPEALMEIVIERIECLETRTQFGTNTIYDLIKQLEKITPPQNDPISANEMEKVKSIK